MSDSKVSSVSENDSSRDDFRTPIRILEWLLYAAVALVPMLIVWRLRIVLAPFAIALLLALLINPSIKKLERRGVNRRISLAVISLIFVGIFVLVAIYIVPMLVRQLAALPQLVQGLPDTFAKYQHRWEAFVERAHVPEAVQEAFSEAFKKAQAAMPSTLASIGTSVAKSARFVIWVILIPLATVYFLSDLDRIGSKAINLAPRRYRERIRQTGHDVGETFLGWAGGMAVVSTGNGLLVGLALTILGMPYALIVGVIAILLYPVPYVGPWLTALIAFLTTFATIGVVKGAIAVAFVLALNFLLDSFITPRVVGGRVGLHPVISLMALMIGAELFGVVGMFLALPVAATIQKLLIQAIPRLREEPPEP